MQRIYGVDGTLFEKFVHKTNKKISQLKNTEKRG